MAVYKAIPSAFGKVSKRFLTPSVSTVAMGLASVALYVAMNYLATGNGVILDSVTALSLFIAFYYGLTGFACAWYWRHSLRDSARNLWMRGILPLLGGVILFACIPWLLIHYWKPVNSYTKYTLPLIHWQIGGIFILMVGASLLGVILYFIYKAVQPAYFRGEVLNRDTPTRVPEEIGVPVGLFGIEPFDEEGTEAAKSTSG
jgi:amino acid transporter